MKFRWTFLKLMDEGKVVNLSQLPEYNKFTDESEFNGEDYQLYFNHTTKKFHLMYNIWNEEKEDWESSPLVSHEEARQFALDNNIIYKV